MFSPSKKEVEGIIEGDELLMKYNEKIEEAQDKKEFLEAYDHELANFECGKDEGREEGYYDGFAEGKEEGYYDGFAEGKEEGHEIGYSEGKEKGREIGYTEGQKENQKEIIQNMLEEGLEVETIARYLKLDVTEVKKLKAEIFENKD